jgi:hypothetical protein
MPTNKLSIHPFTLPTPTKMHHSTLSKWGHITVPLMYKNVQGSHSTSRLCAMRHACCCGTMHEVRRYRY